jgi:hypothetical protein
MNKLLEFNNEYQQFVDAGPVLYVVVSVLLGLS